MRILAFMFVVCFSATFGACADDNVSSTPSNNTSPSETGNGATTNSPSNSTMDAGNTDTSSNIDMGSNGTLDSANDTIDDPNCVPTPEFFEAQVWRFMGTQCFACHGDDGIGAQSSNLDLITIGAPEDLLQNLATVRSVAARQSGGTSLLLLKPTGAIAHAGGVQLEETSADYEALVELVERFETPVSCDSPPDDEPVIEDPNADPHAQHPNNLDQDTLFMCADNATPRSSPARIRRMSRLEWIRNVGKWRATQDRSWHGATAANNPFDRNPANIYSTFDADTSIDLPSLDLYLGMIEEAGVGWQEVFGSTRLQRLREDRSLRCFFDAPEPDDACIDNWIGIYLEKAVLFRPPSSEEFERLKAFAVNTLQDEATEGTTRQETIAHITSAAWLTTGALFRTEMGEGEPDAAGRRHLSDHELGQAVTYTLSDRAPGAPATYISAGYTAPLEGYFLDIQSAVADGTISDLDVIETLVANNAGGLDPERLDLTQDWGDDRRLARGEYWVADKIGNFFREWLGYGDVATAFKERPEATSQFDEGGTSQYRSIKTSFDNLLHGYYGDEPLLVHQLDDMIANIVHNDRDVLRNLLTSTQMYVPSSLRYADTSFSTSTVNAHRVYNITGEIAANRDARWVDLPATERAGVLTHPAWLASHGGNFENDPSAVHRGKWIREELLCELVPPLALVMVDAALDPQTEGRPARERIATRIDSNPECTGCHALMNPLGLTFEIYNHAGFVRDSDHGLPPNGSSTLDNMPDDALNGPTNDAVALMHKLAESQHVKRCFIRQTFRYFMGRPEQEADACTLASMEQTYDDTSGSFVAMLQHLMTSDTFLYRHHAEPQP